MRVALISFLTDWGVSMSTLTFRLPSGEEFIVISKKPLLLSAEVSVSVAEDVSFFPNSPPHPPSVLRPLLSSELPPRILARVVSSNASMFPCRPPFDSKEDVIAVVDLTSGNAASVLDAAARRANVVATTLVVGALMMASKTTHD